jgi:hypothetical protein
MTASDKATDRFGAVDNEGERYTVVELLQRSIFRRVKRRRCSGFRRVQKWVPPSQTFGWNYPPLPFQK